ncbi:SPRY domain-containing SOCS box protein 3-like [Neodiprion virginianus]|uniref:SPRY domain-containing SOCS box protein 3-like n=1 Tax=Neodiprion virginianus TaxID=2961670 RepID=UPI001EE6FB87|nr:SPRY domain-containing SOCS box protein 3-like [Neodiprion virginianus]XP_046619570.1 SPRY domain-containing SOCS box protein 3-like [Neodiprion virginianus]
MYFIDCKMRDDLDALLVTPGERYCDCKEDCLCGEQNEIEWQWDEKYASKTLRLSKMNLEVNFNPGYSMGTSAVRGNKLMASGRHHYWEVKMITQVYGTDIMIGVGTSKVNLESFGLTFTSLLGLDSESWGFSYKGDIQHRGQKQKYSLPFAQGSLVGVHLDTWRGTLEFYLNRKPLGIAFTGLRGLELYPMISSTAAQSKIRITHSSSIPVTLQLECLAALKPSLRTMLLEGFPGLRHLTTSIFANILQSSYTKDEDEVSEDFNILDEFDVAVVGFKKSRRSLTQDDGSMPGTARRECEMCGNTTSVLFALPLCTICCD